MRIVSISKIRDEADILDFFIRYHLRMVDHMIIMNHHSTDSSGEILRKYGGSSVTVIDNADPAHEQSTCLTSLMRKAIKEQQADWILPLDADEFLRTDDDCHRLLDTLPRDRLSQIPWRTYVPVNTQTDTADVLLQIPFRCDYEPFQFYKILIPSSLVEETSVISEGSHGMYNAAKLVLFPVEAAPHWSIAHFPVRTEKQLRQKIMNACEARQKLSGHFEAGRSYHLKALEKKLQECPSLTQEELSDIALWYAMPVHKNERKPELVYDPLSIP